MSEISEKVIDGRVEHTNCNIKSIENHLDHGWNIPNEKLATCLQTIMINQNIIMEILKHNLKK